MLALVRALTIVVVVLLLLRLRLLLVRAVSRLRVRVIRGRRAAVRGVGHAVTSVTCAAARVTANKYTQSYIEQF